MASDEKLALIVDSGDSSGRRAGDVLRKAGITVEIATTVREAVARIGQRRPDIIICNPVAPDREGFDLVTWLLTWLQADPQTRAIPRLFLLPSNPAPDLLSTLQASPDDYLIEPFDKATLERRVAKKMGEQGENARPQPRRRERQRGPKNRPPGERTFLWVVIGLVLALAVPYFLYLRAPDAGIDLATPMFVVVACALLLNALFTSIQGFFSWRGRPAPLTPERTASGTAIVLATLPEESVPLAATIDALLEQKFPLEIVLVVQTRGEPFESALRSRTDGNWRVRVTRVPRGTTTTDKIAAGLRDSRGEVVGVFSAGQLPERNSFHQAWRWIGSGYGMVRGRLTAANRSASWVARLTALDLITDRLAASLAGGIPGTTNVYWNRGVVAGLPMISGRRNKQEPVAAAYDGTLVAARPVPTTLGRRWQQEIVWAQNWSWLSPRQIWRAMHAPSSSRAEHAEAFEQAVWRRPYVWVAAQVFPLSAYLIWSDGPRSAAWHVPVGVLLALYLLTSGPARAIAAFGLAAPDERQHKLSFLSYMVVSSLLLSPLDNLADRSAQLKEVFGRAPRRRHVFLREVSQPKTQATPPPPAVSVFPKQQESPVVPEVLPPRAPDTAAILAQVSATLDRLQATEPTSQIQIQGVTAMEDHSAMTNNYSGPDHFPTVDDPWTRDLAPVTEPETASAYTAPQPQQSNGSSSTSSVHDAATSALEHSQELLGLVKTLVQQVEALESEKDALRTQAEALQEEVGRQAAFRKTLLAGPATAVAADEVRALQGLVDSLVQEPYHIGVLAQIGGHSTALAAVVSGYSQMRSMLSESESSGQDTPQADPQPAEESPSTQYAG